MMNHRKCKPRKYTVTILNKILEENLQAVRIIEMETRMLKLTNGVVITEQQDIKKFRVRVLSKISVKYIDGIYSTDGKQRQQALSDMNVELKGIKTASGFTTWERYGNLAMVDWVKTNGSPRKGKKSNVIPWQKGKTKLTDERLAKLSESKMGEKNHRFAKKWSDEYKQQSSIRMKNKILNNEFTPNSNNRQTHFDCLFNGKKYRSSWEAVYHSLNNIDEYEQLRIPYFYDGKNRVYIVDFVNHLLKRVVEVKPSNLLQSCDKTRIKLEYLEEWCHNNEYKLELFTEVDIFNNRDKIQFEAFDVNTALKIKKVIYSYENSKSYKNRKA